MKRHVAALVAILFLGSLATPSAAHDPAASLVGHELRGVPTGNPGEYVLSRESFSNGPPQETTPDMSNRVLPVAALPSAEPISVRTGTNHEGEVGTALYSASMTWCAPRGDQCTNWGGAAQLAAVNSFRWGDAPYWVRIWRGQDHADALVISHCACNGQDGYIDVSPYVFRQLAPLSRGRLDVAVEVLTWPGDSEDPPPHPSDEEMRREDAPRVTAPPTDR